MNKKQVISTIKKCPLYQPKSAKNKHLLPCVGSF